MSTVATASEHGGPLVSCLMVTRDRPLHLARAASLFLRQTHGPSELVIVDDGAADQSPLLPPGRPGRRIRYVHVTDGVARTLGELRNLSLDHAAGDWWIQWDDDDWYHPERVAVQLAAATSAGADGSALRWTLMHVDTPELRGRPFRADTGFATPGTLLHRRTELRYPPVARGEDSRLLATARRRGSVAVLGREASHLFARCYHGANTWSRRHFVRRLRRRPADWPSWIAAAVVHGDLRHHRAFRLDPRERDAAAHLVRDLGLGGSQG